MAAVRLRHERDCGALLLDTRPAEEFASLHASGAIHIDLQGNFASWAAILLRPSERLLLIADSGAMAQEARERLARVGLVEVIGYARVDEKEWRAAGIELARIPLKRCSEIASSQQDQPLPLVDARSRAEWLQGHLPGAISVPLLELGTNATRLYPSPHGFVYCREGFRATTAASLLLREGVRDVGILIDGVEGWLALGLPLQMPEIQPSG